MEKKVDVAYKGDVAGGGGGGGGAAAAAETELRTAVLKQHCVPDRYHGDYP